MKAVNQTPTPAELAEPAGETKQIPMAVESFVRSLGISLTEEQKTQLHGLLNKTKPRQRRCHQAQENRSIPGGITRTLRVTLPAKPKFRGGLFLFRSMTCSHGKTVQVQKF